MRFLRLTLLFTVFFVSINSFAGDKIQYKDWLHVSQSAADKKANVLPRIMTISKYDASMNAAESFAVDYFQKEPDLMTFTYVLSAKNWPSSIVDDAKLQGDNYLFHLVIDGDESKSYFIISKFLKFENEMAHFSGLPMDASFKVYDSRKLIEKFKKGSSFKIELLSSGPNQSPLTQNTFSLMGFSKMLNKVKTLY